VIDRLSWLALEITLDGHDLLLIRAVHSLVIIVFIVASSNHDPLGCLFWPFLLPWALFLAPLPVALGGALDVISDPFLVALNENGPNRFFTRSMSGGNVKQLLGGL
jgi:hypothetical protein